jgi:flagellar basal-body rod protein FlgG
MASLRREIFAALSIVFVATALIAGHRMLPRHPASARPAKLPANDREDLQFERSLRVTGTVQTTEANDLSQSACPGGCAAIAKTFKAKKAGRLMQTAADEPAAPPLPLPAQTGATPLEFDRPTTSASGGSVGKVPINDVSAARNSEARSRSRRMVEAGLPSSTPEDREIFYDVVKDLPPHDLREILRLREQLGSISGLTPPKSSLPNAPPLISSPQRDRGKPAIVPPTKPIAPASSESAGRTAIRGSLAAIASAREILTDNLAHANIVGFKRRVPVFDTVLEVPSVYLKAAGSQSPTNGATAAGTMDATMDMSQGRIRETGRTLDLAIEGEGFFQLRGPAGKLRYTRCGRLTIAAGGRVCIRVSGQECPIEPEIQVPRGVSQIHVSADGDIKIAEPTTGTLVLVGSIPLARFLAPSDLRSAGESVYQCNAMTADVGTANTLGRGRICQGCLEAANVELAAELAELQRLEKQRQALEQAARLLDSM